MRLVMISEYIHYALEKARYEILPDDDTYYGEIPGFRGVWANADTLESCRRELQETLEEWILIRLRMNKKVPKIEGIDLNVKKAV
jgi:predicted RNase H-like HicB family nuclease